MMKTKIINVLSVIALILLITAFIFPFIRTYSGPFTWIWGFPYNPLEYINILDIPFKLLSIGMLVEILFLLKSQFILRKDNTKLDDISRGWLNRGIAIIVIEFFWIAWLFVLLFTVLDPDYIKYFIEVPIFFPLICGIMLITARILFNRLPFRESENNVNTDLQWLEIQHYELKKSIQEIASEQNVSMMTIKKFIEKIDRKQKDK
ncbi:MAG: hypothetical protein E3J90_06745 [Promethearchaeota archaeon]|nr:MAG: hypothetical protein E3J90_06745 [Candidatus Lokiarchaeota archaeon]